MTTKIHLPSDEDIKGYDLDKLEGEVKQHMENIKVYENILVEEKTHLIVAENVVIRKRQLLEEEKNNG